MKKPQFIGAGIMKATRCDFVRWSLGGMLAGNYSATAVIETKPICRTGKGRNMAGREVRRYRPLRKFLNNE